MKNRRNYYRILHVQPDAPSKIIEASYRTLMLKLRHHPDLGGDHWNASLINEAKAVLTDPKKRAEYDRQLKSESLRSAAQTSRTTRQTEANHVHRSSKGYGTTFEQVCVFCATQCHRTVERHFNALCGSCHSPLYPARKLILENSCLRAIKRVTKLCQTVFFTRWPQQRGLNGQVQDLSLNGMQMRTDIPLPPGQIIKIQSDLLLATGRVTYCKAERERWSNKYVTGLEFLTLKFERSRGTFLTTKA